MFDSSYFTDPLAFLVQVTFGFYVLVVVLRFLLQVLRADFYNPLSQFVVKLTTPVLRPLRRVIPPISALDLTPMAAAIGLVLIKMLVLPPLDALTGNPF